MKSLFEAVHIAAPPALKNSADSTRKPRRAPGPRRQQIEAEHKVALSRAYVYQAERTRNAEELAALDAAYEARMNEGPDFTRYRDKSRFGEAPLHRLDREGIHKLRFAFNSMARKAWLGSATGKHRGVISRTCKDVFGALLYMAERYDRLFPSLERIAALAQCCKQSVVTALETLETLGFITRHRRLRMVEGLLGRKAEQNTNGYELHTPRTAWGRLTLALFGPNSESKNWSATVTEDFQLLKRGQNEKQQSALTGAYGGSPMAIRI
jgi:hypothetical protein